MLTLPEIMAWVNCRQSALHAGLSPGSGTKTQRYFVTPKKVEASDLLHPAGTLGSRLRGNDVLVIYGTPCQV